MTRGSAFTLKLCRRNILWLVGALMLVILFHLYFIKVIKTVTRDDDHFLSLPKEFLSPSHKKVSMNRFRIHLKEQCIGAASCLRAVSLVRGARSGAVFE